MNKLQWCTLLLATVLVCAQSHRLLAAEGQIKGRNLAEVTDSEDAALEHQRILAELEEVHQLRERMLQEGEHYQRHHALPHCGAATHITHLELCFENCGVFAAFDCVRP